MKGKKTFSYKEIQTLKELINLRNQSSSSAQKAIRQKMRDIGFYGKADWGITDLQISDLDHLIKSDKITVINVYPDKSFFPSMKVPENEKLKKPNTIEFDYQSVENILTSFENRCFDPLLDTESKISNNSGNYILCLKVGAKLREVIM